MIFLNRSNPREAMRSLKLAGERIRAGSNILAFPEGTRSLDGRILPFKKGSFVLAVEAGVPIIPMAIEGTRRHAPPGQHPAAAPPHPGEGGPAHRHRGTQGTRSARP